MTIFQKLFGIKESQIKDTCILLPLLAKDVLKYLGINGLSRGKVYSSGNADSFSIIHTGMGPAFTGDAVLYLGQTPCKTIILFGSCGLVKQEKDLTIGSLVTPRKSYSLESFSSMLSGYKEGWEVFNPDKDLVEKFLVANKTCDIKKVTCATLGSLKLEDAYLGLFKRKDIRVVDMECSPLFSASSRAGKSAMALFYVTDIMGEKPFYVDLEDREKQTLSLSIKTAAHMLCEFIEKNLID